MVHRELLEQLRVMMDCLFISDLKSLDKDDLYVAIKNLNVKDFSKAEWQETIAYLTGQIVDKDSNEYSLKEYLCKYYID